jgi:flagellar biosynthesis component FlhA
LFFVVVDVVVLVLCVSKAISEVALVSQSGLLLVSKTQLERKGEKERERERKGEKERERGRKRETKKVSDCKY